MTIKQGFLFILLCLTGWISAVYLMEKVFPVKEKIFLSTWYGEIHFEAPYSLPHEYDNPYDSTEHAPYYMQQEPKDDKGAE